ncbi:MAG: RNA degradosome polyphosphate kinase [Alistipes sp.]|nr:RNA degradosome polyphosphate kinase [Alistipes sp.]
MKRMIDRDISWIYFNRRILQEAQREEVPLLERLKYLGIYSNNLDEFFRVRVSAMKRVVEYATSMEREPTGACERDQDPLVAAYRLREIARLTYDYSMEFDATFETLKRLLAEERIFLIDETQLNAQQRDYIHTVYRNDLNSVTYPLILTQGAQVGELTDSSIYLAVRMANRAQTREDFALIELPTGEFDRFIELPTAQGEDCILFLDDMVRCCLPLIFAGLGYDTFEAYTLKFTRDAEMALEGDVEEGLVEKVARGVKQRKKGEPIRLVYDRRMPEAMLRYFEQIFVIDSYDTCVGGGRYHNMKDLMDFPHCHREDLRFAPQPPVEIPEMGAAESLLALIRRQDLYLHYPYHSFSNYLRLLREAALSPEVEQIRTTVYRLAKDSQVVKALICAARHGKRVTVAVELMARFDEASNIHWSRKMQEAGIEVLFGMEGQKVHCKLTSIALHDGTAISCVSTGNFHEGNARSYTDVTLLTANPALGAEVCRVFDLIRCPTQTVEFHHLWVSPHTMRQGLMARIDREIAHAQAGRPAYILCKINHITDTKMVRKLYAAARAGVKLHLMVRGNCSLVPSEVPNGNLQVRGIIDRYLEHSRIVIFGNGGGDQEECWMGSADWMPRNLDHRIEVYVPVYDPKIKAELRRIVCYGLQDNQAARVVDGTDANTLYENGGAPFRSQRELYRYYQACHDGVAVADSEVLHEEPWAQ